MCFLTPTVKGTLGTVLGYFFMHKFLQMAKKCATPPSRFIKDDVNL